MNKSIPKTPSVNIGRNSNFNFSLNIINNHTQNTIGTPMNGQLQKESIDTSMIGNKGQKVVMRNINNGIGGANNFCSYDINSHSKTNSLAE